jgi:cob(I)alamin adenosyltransferase
MISMRKRIQEAEEVLIEEGFTIVRREVRGHVKFWAEMHGKVRMFVTAGSPSDKRNLHHFRAFVRRTGRELSGGSHG